MILRKALDLSKSIDNHRLDLYELVKKKGFSNPDVIKMSQQLDKKIVMLQRIVYAISS